MKTLSTLITHDIDPVNIKNLLDEYIEEYNNIIIDGLDGLGKTTLALNLAKLMKRKYVYFMKLRDIDETIQSFLNTNAWHNNLVLDRSLLSTICYNNVLDKYANMLNKWLSTNIIILMLPLSEAYLDQIAQDETFNGNVEAVRKVYKCYQDVNKLLRDDQKLTILTTFKGIGQGRTLDQILSSFKFQLPP